MEHVQAAVILAAGSGTRMRSSLPGKPKGFVELGGQPIIVRSIQQLQAAGIEQIVLVTGYQSQCYEDLARQYTQVRIVQNARYATSGSMYSLYQARELVEPPFLLLDCDLIYEPRAISALLSYSRPNAILLSGTTHLGDEYYVETCGDYYRRTSQNKAELQQVTGEFVGISRIDRTLFDAMLADAEACFHTSLDLNYEVCIDHVAASTEVFFLLIEDLVWAEIDDAEQLRRAEKLVLPKLLGKGGWSK